MNTVREAGKNTDVKAQTRSKEIIDMNAVREAMKYTNVIAQTRSKEIMDMNVKTKMKRILALCLIMWLLVLMFTAAPVYGDSTDKLFALEVTHHLVTSSYPVDDEFKFRLEPYKEDHPMPDGSGENGYTFLCKENSRIEIWPKSHHIGLYRYKLYQVIDEEKPGYKYDKQVYDIEIYVNAQQDTEILVYKEDGTKAQAIAFENIFLAAETDPSLMVDPPVKKTVTGNPRSNSRFQFNLEAGNKAWPMPAGSKNGIKTLYITGEGEAEFGQWSYNQPGVYFYKIYEVNTRAAGYTYDRTVYTITDTVTDEGGQLVLSRIVTDNLNKNVSEATFNNIYNNIYNNVLYNVSNSGNLPRTWDETDISFFVALIVLSAMVASLLTFILIFGRQRRERETK